MAKFSTKVDEKGNTVHHGECGHDFPGTGQRGRPFRNCPKCRKASAAPTERKPRAKAAKKSGTRPGVASMI
jgi:hypothetical protein